MLRATVARNARLFTTSARFQKSTVDSVKDAAKKVDRTVSNAAVKGIEKGGTSSTYHYMPPQLGDRSMRPMH